MGAVASVAAAFIPPVLTAVVGVLWAIRGASSGGRVRENPVLQELEHRIQQQQLAIEAASANQASAEEARRLAEDAFRQSEEHRRRFEESSRLQEEARLRAEEARARAEEERADEERVRAEAEARRAQADQQRADKARQDAERTAAEARAAREKAEKDLREGIRPIIIPTQAQLRATKLRLQYREGLFHFAIAGIAGSGKSSLINAFRGLRNKDRSAAPTGVVETTSVITRYPDPSAANPFVWYDVPGAGTLSIPDWQYFTDQGLYAFDCIVVLFDNRFTATDVAILRNCTRFQIPTYIVRSKSRQHIQNAAEDMVDEDDDVVERAREQYIRETRASVARNLEAAGLPKQRVYMVDKEALCKVVKGRQPEECIDEWELLRDLLSEARRRRRARQAAERAAAEARAQQEEAERQLRAGAQPVVVPTLQQIREAKQRLQYQEGYVHIAVAGIAGSGKSSLINALRGIRNGEAGSAETGIVETTSVIARYPDPNPNKRVVWYDVPGAGTLSIPDWEYFTNQGLYVFDCILVLFDARFTETDVAILRNCARFRIPAYVVRSKARQHIRNLAQDIEGEDDDSEDEAGLTSGAVARAREKYVRESRESVARNLELAELPQQRVYLVDKQTLILLSQGQHTGDTIDESDLLGVLAQEAQRVPGHWQ
ncbi:P-loop containing nucleoside triphosphate hydrolase protein [Rhodofomes roseus]|uniref:P-loop containing nucleoside triphosphate hydrolase protein n=1 Tax=Rhodofomes roseus TaxID=34475 RepID=A0ABQ8K765_9APHY|nr:P-loop containing nucleoside triphosphate hydrolase protein [Rhodofomes roseus]KAH9832882.1 P-loop containing nucleoside triphosphate hydrolase protein [Rhodofomes roseus]